MKVVFINYRRSDASADARLLYAELSREAGLDVFMDVDNIATRGSPADLYQIETTEPLTLPILLRCLLPAMCSA